jgi:hypothetical protein
VRTAAGQCGYGSPSLDWHGIAGTCTPTGSRDGDETIRGIERVAMARKTNFGFEKRQKDLKKKEKRDAKAEKKRIKAESGEPDGAEGEAADGDDADDDDDDADDAEGDKA